MLATCMSIRFPLRSSGRISDDNRIVAAIPAYSVLFLVVSILRRCSRGSNVTRTWRETSIPHGNSSSVRHFLCYRLLLHRLPSRHRFRMGTMSTCTVVWIYLFTKASTRQSLRFSYIIYASVALRAMCDSILFLHPCLACKLMPQERRNVSNGRDDEALSMPRV